MSYLNFCNAVIALPSGTKFLISNITGVNAKGNRQIGIRFRQDYQNYGVDCLGKNPSNHYVYLKK